MYGFGIGANIHGNIHWMIPRALNSLFTGRSDLLDRIQSALQSESICLAQTQRRFVITGLGEQGKSEICLQIASLMKHKFWGIFWIDVDNPSTAERDFIAVAKLLGHSAETVHEAHQALTNTQQSWLLILDNADDPYFDYQVYFPPGNHGAVLMTTCITKCRMYSPDAFEALEGLGEEDSKNLLLKAAELPRKSWSSCGYDAKEVVNLLGSHTLALIQAGAYIGRGFCELHKYPNVFRRHRQLLLECRPIQAQSRYRDVYATFEASAERLKQAKSEAAKDALDLLAILSVLSTIFLPLQIFESAWNGSKAVRDAPGVGKKELHVISRSHVQQLPSFLMAESDNWESRRLKEAIYQLFSLSLITRHDSPAGVSMHVLAYAWVKDRLDQTKQDEAWIATKCVLVNSRLETHICKPRKDLEMLLLVEQCIKAHESMIPASNLEMQHEIAVIYQIIGSSKRAVEILENIIETEKLLLEVDNPSRLESMQVLALAYKTSGQLQHAVNILKQVIDIRHETLAPNDRDLLETQDVLAKILKRMSK
ncbi:hypothetical protein IFR05_013127 [Cadophora sp. M221]|nr:hypothetical protein IFR05_013127 [Cadophora sp. M221]